MSPSQEFISRYHLQARLPCLADLIFKPMPSSLKFVSSLIFRPMSVSLKFISWSHLQAYDSLLTVPCKHCCSRWGLLIEIFLLKKCLCLKPVYFLSSFLDLIFKPMSHSWLYHVSSVALDEAYLPPKSCYQIILILILFVFCFCLLTPSRSHNKSSLSVIVPWKFNGGKHADQMVVHFCLHGGWVQLCKLY